MELGDKSSRWSLLDEEGAVVEGGQRGDDQESDAENLRRPSTVPHCDGGGDTFTGSASCLAGSGYEVLVANARQRLPESRRPVGFRLRLVMAA
jgi:hypothetical protein